MRSPTPFDTQALRDYSPPSIDTLSTPIGREVLMFKAVIYFSDRVHAHALPSNQPSVTHYVRAHAKTLPSNQPISRPPDGRLARSSDRSHANALPCNIASITHVTADSFNFAHSSDRSHAKTLPFNLASLAHVTAANFNSTRSPDVARVQRAAFEPAINRPRDRRCLQLARPTAIAPMRRFEHPHQRMFNFREFPFFRSSYLPPQSLAIHPSQPVLW
ncbi:hypothetical protein FB451DRAFT_1493172 [Mycena latifolia]|nr:hypothetical protein FB451DRAFT_1493172 [Mycena latifolia]